MIDKIRFFISLVFVVAGIAGFYFLGEFALVFKVLSVLAGVLAGGVVAWFTKPGQHFVGFAREAIAEGKKVVWPSKKETVQTTGVVFVLVIVMATFLWLADKGLEWMIYDLLLGWKMS